MTWCGQHGLDKILHDRYFAGHVGTVIECGALDGLTLSHSKGFEELGWRSINVEPVPALYAALCRNRPNAININAALSDSVGVVQFTQAVHPASGQLHGNGSIEHCPEHLRILNQQGCSFEQYEVRTVTYSDIVAGLDSVDLMILDVEGAELKAIAGFCDPFPRFLSVEVYFSGFDAVASALMPYGYRHEFTHVDDAVFVR